MSPKRQSRQRQRAFNLIELLVVIAIIAILASLLLPAVSAAKARAYVVKCKSNEKQLALAWYLYAGDNSDLIVPNGYQTRTNATDEDKLWVLGSTHRGDSLGFFPGAFTNTDYLVNPEHAAFARYIKSPEIYKCPADHSLYENDQPKVRSYSLNGFLNWTKPPITPPPTDYKMFRRISALAASKANPSGILLFLDVAPNWICHAAFVTAMPFAGATDDQFYHFPSTEHSRSGVVSFTDGHVESHRWKSQETIEGGHAPFVVHGNYSKAGSNPDLQWLRAHATVPQK